MATIRTQHAGAARMPFGEISGDRLQNLASMKNRQNALHVLANTSTKRKATESIDIFCDSDDNLNTENIDPTASLKNKSNILSNKRSKTSTFTKSAKFETIVKPAFSTSIRQTPTTSLLPSTAPPQRKIAKAKSRLQTQKQTTRTIDLSHETDKMLNDRLKAPAGRSPQTGRPRVSSLLSDRARLAAPAFGPSRLRSNNTVGLVKSASLISSLNARGMMPFDLAAALEGTVPTGYSSPSGSALSLSASDSGHLSSDDCEDAGALQAMLPKSSSAPALRTPTRSQEYRASWDFLIHEDTEDQERENILSHSTDQLGLSGDESSNRDSFASDKENVPPAHHTPSSTPRRSHTQTMRLAVDITPTQANGLAQAKDEDQLDDDETVVVSIEHLTTPHHDHVLGNCEHLSSPGHKLGAFSPTGEPAEDWERPSPGGLPRSPGMMNLSHLVGLSRQQGSEMKQRSTRKERPILGELPLEEFIRAEAKEEEAKTGEKGDSWFKKGSTHLYPIDEAEQNDESSEDIENKMDTSIEKAEAEAEASPVEVQMFHERLREVRAMFPQRTSSLEHAEII